MVFDSVFLFLFGLRLFYSVTCVSEMVYCLGIYLLLIFIFYEFLDFYEYRNTGR